MLNSPSTPGVARQGKGNSRLPMVGCIPLPSTVDADPNEIKRLCSEARAAEDENSDVAGELASLIRPDLLHLFA